MCSGPDTNKFASSMRNTLLKKISASSKTACAIIILNSVWAYGIGSITLAIKTGIKGSTANVTHMYAFISIPNPMTSGETTNVYTSHVMTASAKITARLATNTLRADSSTVRFVVIRTPPAIKKSSVTMVNAV